MAEQIRGQIKQSLKAAEGLYHRLVLLVGLNGSGKTSILQNIATNLETTVININLELSSKLLELTAKQRSLQLPELLGQIICKIQSPVILDNLEILFDQNLKQDPLRLLQSISRNQTIIASWNGTFTGGKLVYAEVGHPEYRSYDSVDVLIVNIDDSTTTELSNNILEARKT